MRIIIKDREDEVVESPPTLWNLATLISAILIAHLMYRVLVENMSVGQAFSTNMSLYISVIRSLAHEANSLS